VGNGGARRGARHRAALSAYLVGAAGLDDDGTSRRHTESLSAAPFSSARRPRLLAKHRNTAHRTEITDALRQLLAAEPVLPLISAVCSDRVPPWGACPGRTVILRPSALFST